MKYAIISNYILLCVIVVSRKGIAFYFQSHKPSKLKMIIREREKITNEMCVLQTNFSLTTLFIFCYIHIININPTSRARLDDLIKKKVSTNQLSTAYLVLNKDLSPIY